MGECRENEESRTADDDKNNVRRGLLKYIYIYEALKN